MQRFIVLCGFWIFGQPCKSILLISKRVTGGEPTPPGEFTGMVSLGAHNYFNDSDSDCTGVVLDEYTILTVAHCMIEFKNINNVYDSLELITTGSDFSFYQPNSNAVEINPHDVEVYINPEYILHKVFGEYNEHKYSKYDIAILKIKVPIKFTNSFQPILISFDLPFIDQVNKSYHIIGFGHVTEMGKNNKQHKFGMKKRLNWALISDPLIHLKDGGFNVQTEDQPCGITGDSGGALLELSNKVYTMIGVTQSYQNREAKRLQLLPNKTKGITYFAPIYDNRDFIMSHMGQQLSYCGDADVKKLRDEKFMNSLHQYPSHHIWLLALYSQFDKLMCLATYIGDNIILTAKKCLFNGNKDIRIHKIAGVYEMNYWHKRKILFDVDKCGNYTIVFDENNIIGISFQIQISKLYLLRRVCTHQHGHRVSLNETNLLSIIFENDISNKISIKENTQKFIKYQSQRAIVCTKLDLSNKQSFPTYTSYGPRIGYPLLSIHKGQYFLEGILTNNAHSEDCPNEFSILPDKMRLPANNK